MLDTFTVALAADARRRFLAADSPLVSWRWVNFDGITCIPDRACSLMVTRHVGRGLLSIRLDVRADADVIDQLLGTVV